jgi:transcriptional regulator GlxA family with amidase domain
MPKNIGIVVYRNCTSSMVTGFWDILTQANSLHKEEKGNILFNLELVAETNAPVNSFSGLTFFPHKTFRGRRDYDLIYVPGFIGDADRILNAEQNTVNWLTKKNTAKTILTAACNGNFLLAAAGILNNKKATTHWSLAQKLQRDFKDIIVQPEKIIADNGKVISAAGVTSYFNLALHIIQRFAGINISLLCAKIFLVDAGRKIQTPYQIPHFSKNHGDEMVNNTQDWLENNYRQTISLKDLAGLRKVGQKTLVRRFKKATGETPKLYLQKLRIEKAKRLLESRDITFNEITWEVGYNDVSSFHKVFKLETGLTPIEYRARFLIQ